MVLLSFNTTILRSYDWDDVATCLLWVGEPPKIICDFRGIIGPSGIDLECALPRLMVC
jgi:hypothetical protein